MSDLNQSAASVACGLAAEIIRRFGTLRLRVTGCSMLPLVAPGDVLVIHRRAAPEFAPGQIAVFTRHNRLFVHRVVGKISTDGVCQLFTRGDSLPENDPPVNSGELLGRVEAIERGRRLLRPQQPAGWTLFLTWLGRRSDGALLAMAWYHGLRRFAERRSIRAIPWLAATPQGTGSLEDLSI